VFLVLIRHIVLTIKSVFTGEAGYESFTIKTSMTSKNNSARFNTLRRDGGALCLDFTNTIHDRSVENPRDYVKNFDDLVSWLVYAKGISEADAQLLLARSLQHPIKAKDVFKRAIAFRELLFRVFSGLGGDRTVDPDDLTTLNKELLDMLRYTTLTISKGGVAVVGWDQHADTLKTALWPIARSTLEVLLANSYDRLKKCPRCYWLFFDTSKNGMRRWCSMETCGSMDKSLRYYHRQKSGTRTSS
jgi:predicted RNA-binding Zn ribbon-like protein